MTGFRWSPLYGSGFMRQLLNLFCDQRWTLRGLVSDGISLSLWLGSESGVVIRLDHVSTACNLGWLRDCVADGTVFDPVFSAPAVLLLMGATLVPTWLAIRPESSATISVEEVAE